MNNAMLLLPEVRYQNIKIYIKLSQVKSVMGMWISCNFILVHKRQNSPEIYKHLLKEIFKLFKILKEHKKLDRDSIHSTSVS